MKKEKIKIVTVFGTRKEFIRLYPVLDRLKADADFESIVVTTCQNQENLNELYTLFQITPDHDLNLKRDKKCLSDIANLALSGIEPLLKLHKPDIVLVQGESTTAFIGALASFYNKIHVGHIGAGERTFEKMEPYPEEINRQLVSTLSDLHFVFSAENTVYLIHQGALPRNIFVTGNTIIDTISNIARNNRDTLCKYLPPDDLKTYKTILITSFKKENWGKPLKSLCLALIDLIQAYPDIQIAFPLPFNSGVRETVFKILRRQERIHLLDQLPYETFLEAIDRSHLIITDSDCITEEGYALRKPVLLLRERTGPVDSDSESSVKMIGLKRAGIVVETSRLIEDQNLYRSLINEFSPGGDGHAAERIVQAIRSHFGMGERPKDYRPRADVQTLNHKMVQSL